MTARNLVLAGVIGTIVGGIGHGLPLHAADKLSVVSNGQGSVNYTASLAIGTVLKQKAGLDSTVSPFAGPQVWLNLLDEGSADLGIANAIDVSQAMNGLPPNYKKPHKHLRLVSLTFALLNGVVVRAESGITSLAAARGKRVTGEYVAHQTCREISSGQLASVGLDWKDVNIVPVQSSAAGGEALRAGRVDVNMCAPMGQAILQQLHARTPLRFISVGHDEAAQMRFREHFPTGRPKLVQKGAYFGVEENTWVWEYDFYLATGKHTKDGDIYKITQILWESLPDLSRIAPLLSSMTQERMADKTASFSIPYHPGAIQFFKEKNVWSPAMEAHQQKLIKEASN